MTACSMKNISIIYLTSSYLTAQNIIYMVHDHATHVITHNISLTLSAQGKIDSRRHSNIIILERSINFFYIFFFYFLFFYFFYFFFFVFFQKIHDLTFR